MLDTNPPTASPGSLDDIISCTPIGWARSGPNWLSKTLTDSSSLAGTSCDTLTAGGCITDSGSQGI